MKDNALYLEVDEDITSAIDKLSKSAEGSVQIVVPKRSTMLQSIINLKLLKKAAEQSNKELVLVTGDRIATELAARVGLAVAPSIGAKPVIADVKIPEALLTNEEVIEADDPEPPPIPAESKSKIFKKPIMKRLPISDGPPPSGLPVAPVDSDAGLAVGAGAAAADVAKKTGPKVPNFGRLQKRVMWVGLAVFLVVSYLGLMYLFTTAKVTLYATGTKVEVDTTFAVDPSLKTTDQAKAVLAGQLVTISKDLSGPFVPTGKQDVGTKASGSVSIQNCEDSNVYPLAAGNTLTSQGLSFITNDAITIPAGTFTNGGKNCTSPTVSVTVTASQNGDKYNLTNASFSNAKLTSNFKINGAQMSGGTTKTVNIVAQSDVDTEKVALLDKDKDNSTRDLQGRVPSGFIALPSSQTSSADTTTPSPAVGAQGDTASLDLKVTYTVLAVKQSEYGALIHSQEQKQVGDQNQIYDDGLAVAQVTATDKDSTGRQNFHLTTEAFGGTKLDKTQIAAKLKSQRYGDASTIASGLPGVTRADILIWPGWVSKLPSRPDKISITIQVAGNK
jgi:hypothetical protein